VNSHRARDGGVNYPRHLDSRSARTTSVLSSRMGPEVIARIRSARASFYSGVSSLARVRISRSSCSSALPGVVQVSGNMMTGCEGVFAGGDMVPAERTVTVAVGHGKKAARHIDACLRGDECMTS